MNEHLHFDHRHRLFALELRIHDRYDVRAVDTPGFRGPFRVGADLLLHLLASVKGCDVYRYAGDDPKPVLRAFVFRAEGSDTPTRTLVVNPEQTYTIRHNSVTYHDVRGTALIDWLTCGALEAPACEQVHLRADVVSTPTVPRSADETREAAKAPGCEDRPRRRLKIDVGPVADALDEVRDLLRQCNDFAREVRRRVLLVEETAANNRQRVDRELRVLRDRISAVKEASARDTGQLREAVSRLTHAMNEVSRLVEAATAEPPA